MRLFLQGSVILLASVAGVAAQQDAPLQDQPREEALEKRLKELQDQLDEFRKKQSGLEAELKQLLDKKQEKERLARQEAERKDRERQAKLEAERKAKDEAEKKKQYAKLEIRGKLLKVGEGVNYQLAINELNWTLDFGKSKELVAQAEKLKDKAVIVIGKAVTKRSTWSYGTPGGMPFPPMSPWGWQQPQPNPWGWPQVQIQPNPYYIPQETVVITVESIIAAKD